MTLTVELDRADLIRLIKGTGGPSSYVYDTRLGSLYGFPNERWQWNDAYLNNLMITQLWDVYQQLKSDNT